MTIKQLIGMPSLIVNNIYYSYSLVKIYASIKAKRAKCPVCEKYSNKIHDHYIRTISDLPIFQNKTTIFLKTRKFKCQNPQCNRKVFSEQTPYILRYSRRTKRVSKLLDSLSIELTGYFGLVVPLLETTIIDNFSVYSFLSAPFLMDSPFRSIL